MRLRCTRHLQKCSSKVSSTYISCSAFTQKFSVGVRHQEIIRVADKFTDNVEPSKESFVFRSSCWEPAKNGVGAVAAGGDDDLHRRDIGTEMTPLGSSTTSRCHTPIKSASPPRHNTPTGQSGPLVPYNGGGGMDISELTDCHFAKLDLGAQFWSSKEEEEEEVSKSLRDRKSVV